MKRLVWSEIAVLLLFVIDEVQFLPMEYLPHWLKVSLFGLGVLAIIVKRKFDVATKTEK
jgi:hypothetical protein